MLVYTTVGSAEESRQIASSVIERRLAACAHISQIESFYRWRGAVQHAPEWRVLFKTTADRYAELERAIREQHSYELPAIFAVDIDHIFEPYADWLSES